MNARGGSRTERLHEIAADHDAVDWCGQSAALQLLAHQVELRPGFSRLGVRHQCLHVRLALAPGERGVGAGRAFILLSAAFAAMR